MTTTPTFVLPSGSLPQTAMQEQLSIAYVHMVATAAGMTLMRHDTDYIGVDLTLKSLVRRQIPGGSQVEVDLQLKATTQDLGPSGVVSWSLDRRTYEFLTDPYRTNLACLGVLLLPNDPVQWLEHDTAGLLAKSHLYWQRATDFPALRDGQGSVTIRLSKDDRFGPAEALSFVEEASTRWI